MAKYSTCEEEVQNIVHEVACELGLEQFMDFEALYIPKSKEIVSVSKASAIAEYLSSRSDLILVLIYADVFNTVDEKTKYMWIRMAMEQIYFDSEKDKIFIGKDNVTIPVSFINKYEKLAVDTALAAYHSIAQIQEKEREKKEQEKAEKAAKRKSKQQKRY